MAGLEARPGIESAKGQPAMMDFVQVKNSNYQQRLVAGDNSNRWRAIIASAVAFSTAALLMQRRSRRRGGYANPARDEKSSESSWIGIVVACCFINAQYGMLHSFGSYSSDLPKDAATVSSFYAAANFGACALAVPAGVAFDRLGAAKTTALGGLLAFAGLVAARTAILANQDLLAQAGYLAFGFGSTLLNTIAVLSAIRAAPEGQAARVSAAVTCSLAVAMSFHTAVYSLWFGGKPLQYLIYQASYSIGACLLGIFIFESGAWKQILLNEAKSQQSEKISTGNRAATSHDQNLNGENEFLLQFAALRRILQAPDMPYFMALWMVPVSYSFALMGSWSQWAVCLGISEEGQKIAALSIGLASAAGRIFFGWLADSSPKGASGSALSIEVGLTGALLLFELGFAVLEWQQRYFFRAALLTHSFSWGGLLTLVPVCLKKGLAARDLGTAYGLLFQVLFLTFMLFNRGAVPSPGCSGPGCFRNWFRIAGIFNGMCLIWGIKRCVALRSAPVSGYFAKLRSQSVSVQKVALKLRPRVCA
eukprot:TRINITY_DN13957_c1_g4_i1.p1 TRINITY_DN13957_c1_g4~~TRINITY_DN13957_c1_g4_i1.p1  ORF type:complete len:535 (+),score=105.46 TRINITY_DN13957_c1_g4_i1:159-1763(+)